MQKKQMGKKRATARSQPNRGKFVLNSGKVGSTYETQMVQIIQKWNFFRSMFGATSGDVRSFHIYTTKSGQYYTLYLTDSATSPPRFE
jgi:hypothetical protein